MLDFQLENVEMPDIDLGTLEQWVDAVADCHGFVVGEICYHFCNDEDILRYNNEYLGHDYYTDVITFDYTQDDIISGDIVISLDTVKSNAEDLNLPYSQELRRVLIHGVLHLCGINDKAPGEREVMEAEENRALELLAKIKG